MANITAAEHPKLVLEMTAMERTTPAHYDEWNVRHQQLLDNCLLYTSDAADD